MSRVVRTSALLAALALPALATASGAGAATAGAAAAAGAGSPQAHAAGKCNISGQERSFGTTYVTSITVKRTSCATGKAVVRAFHKCRKGPRGRCHHRVKGFKCKERRSGIAVQFNSRVTCKRGGKVVKHTYTQNT
jgi:hypothetical protein